MRKQEFIDNYVATFLATFSAIHYDDYCSRGLHEEFHNQPVEDAEHLAELAWKSLEEHKA